jgi:hypothetical protein
VTKEQLAAALHDNIPCKWGPHRGFLAKTHDEYHQWQADAIFAALPAAAPAEGLAEWVLRDLDTIIGQLRDNGFADWPDWLARIRAAVAAALAAAGWAVTRAPRGTEGDQWARCRAECNIWHPYHAPARADEGLRERIAHAVGKALYGWGDDEPNTATGFMVRYDVKAVTDAVMQALPAAGPAEGLRREHKRNSGHDFDPKCGYCTMLAAAPAEGLREALNIPDTIPTTCHTHRLYDCWQCRPRIAIEAASDDDKRRAALARHESGSE